MSAEDCEDEMDDELHVGADEFAELQAMDKKTCVESGH